MPIDDAQFLLASDARVGAAALHPDRNFDTIACTVGLAQGGFAAFARLAFGGVWMPLAQGHMRALEQVAREGRRAGGAPGSVPPGGSGADVLEVRRTLDVGADGRLRVECLRAWLSGGAESGVVRVVLNGDVGPYLCRPLQMGADVVIEPFVLPDAPGIIAVAVARGERALERFASALASLPGAGAATGVALAGGHVPSVSEDVLLAGMLPTLSLRAQRRGDTALAVAHFLSMHPGVAWASYPGLPDDDANDAARRTLEHGFGPLVTFGLRDGARPLESASDLPTDGFPIGDGVLSTLFRTSPSGVYLLSTGLEDALDVVGALEAALASAFLPSVS